MSTAYFSRIRNTVVSGNELRSYLTGADIRDLEFEAATRSAPALNVSATTVGTGAVLTADQWVQAAVSSLVVAPSSTAASLYISLGAGAANSQALAYIDLFNLKSTNDVRILNFVSNISSLSGADVNLATTDGASTFVSVSSGADTARVAALPLLENRGTGMLPRVVLVSATNLSAGSQAVNFNIVPSI